MREPTGEEFSAPRWLANAHLQTLGAALPFWTPKELPPGLPSTEETLTVPLAEGGALKGEAFWHTDPDGKTSRRRTVILLHGVGGSSHSRYMVRASHALFRRGLHVVRLNLRGAGYSVASAPSLYHAGLTNDPRTVVEFLSRDPRVDGIAIVGFSLGGNVALKLAGEWGHLPPSPVKAICTLSAPLDLDATSRRLEELRNLPYRMYILRGLVTRGELFAQLHPELTRYEPRSLRRLTSIREYDRRVIVPMHGFASVEDYYGRSSAGPYLHAIEIPTLMLHAEDDPMVPLETLGAAEDASPHVSFVTSKRGGHVGWFGGMGEKLWVDTWAVDRVFQFVSR
jgi:predicted alpha/beta-fold hydrolase